MSAHHHLTTADLIAMTEGDAELQSALEQCHVCREDYQRLQDAVGYLQSSDAEVDLLPSLTPLLDAARPRKTPWLPLGVGVALAVASVALVILAPNLLDQNDFHRKGNSATDVTQWTGVQGFVVTPQGTSRPLVRAMHTNDGLAFVYTNASDTPFSFLAVFAIDATGEVRWYYPGYSSSASQPLTVPIQAGARAQPLPEQIRHPLPLGMLHVYALFTHTPRSVLDIETAVGRGALDQMGFVVDVASVVVE